MRYFTKLSALVIFGVLFWVPVTTNAQTIGNCDAALAENYLDINNVRARIPNNGELFYRGEPHVYNVPKTTTSNALFASGIWVGGQVGGQIRVAATRYGPYEFWAGPLKDDGSAPDDCAPYDRSYKVSRADVDAYEAGGAPSPDLADWPTGLGAPTLDADGNEIDMELLLSQPLSSRKDRVIDLAAGERPAILGDQSIWWIMNDMGNTHNDSDSNPIGLEVHAMVFAFDVAGDIGNATFYKYRLFYKGTQPLEKAYMSIFSDPDLGDAGDDYVGSDTTLGVGFVYNSTDFDGGSEGYGNAPPAVGYDFFQGPIVPSPGDTAHVSGKPVPDFKNLKMTSFVYYNNGGGINEDPGEALHYYYYMQSRWKDGNPILFGGDGYQTGVTSTPAKFMYPGDPVEKKYWSELNIDGQGNANSAADRRFVLTSGPFTINPGDVQEIVFGIPYGRGTDNLNSVAAMRDADALAQAAFDVQFQLPSAPARPDVKFTELDGKVVVEWSNKPTSNNYLESYYAIDPFAPLTDPDYVFEGYRIYKFTENADLTGTVIQTYDVPDGVKQVIDGFPGQPTSITFNGKDNGVQTYATIDGLTNYQTYHFGLQAVAYNESSYPKIFGSPIVRFDVTPRRSEDVISEAAKDASLTLGTSDFVVSKQANGDGVVSIDIVNPASVREATDYKVAFRELELSDGKSAGVPVVSDGPDDKTPDRSATVAAKSPSATGVTYDIFRGSEMVFNGDINGQVAPQRKNVIVIDGLQFSITGPAPGLKGFIATANAAGPLDPPDFAEFTFNSSGFPNPVTYGLIPSGYFSSEDRAHGGYQQSTNNSAWGFHAGGAGIPYGDEAGPFNQGTTFVGRSIREGWGPIGSDDFEFRFKQSCVDSMNGVFEEGDCLGYRAFDDGDWWMEVPFEVWDVGPTSDPSDDFRMIPVVCESGCGAGTVDYKFDIGGDAPISGGANDPFTDWVYLYKPQDNGATPGEAGYNGFFFGTDDTGDRTFSRLILVNFNGGVYPDVNAELPESGTIYKIVTKKPNAAGDQFSFNTTGYGVQPADAQLKQEQVKEIGIVPNPYKGVSIYERSQLIDEVRFTNLMSEMTTVRIFTLNGSLIRQMEKPAGTRTLTWNLTTDNNLPIASGLYLVHITVEGVGDTVVKFAVVRKRTQLDVF